MKKLWGLIVLWMLAAPLALANPPVFFVTEAQIAQAVKPELLAQGMHPDSDVRVFKLNRPLAAHTDAPDFIISELDYNPASRSFNARVSIAEQPQSSAIIHGKIKRMIEVPVLSAGLRANDLITDDNLDTHMIEDNLVGANIITDRSELIGKAARQSIGARSLIRANMVRNPLAVRKNTLVMITYNLGGLTISNQVRTLDDGSVGEAIRVTNTQTKRIFDATVIGTDQVSANSPASTNTKISANSQK